MKKKELYKLDFDTAVQKLMREKEKIIQNLTNEIFNLKEKLQKISIKLIEKDTEIERLKQDYDEVWEDTLFSVKEDFELNNNCNECRRYYAEEFNKQLAEKEKEKLLNEKEWQDYCAYKIIEPQIKGCFDRERAYLNFFENFETNVNLIIDHNSKANKCELVKEIIYFVNQQIKQLKEMK